MSFLSKFQNAGGRVCAAALLSATCIIGSPAQGLADDQIIFQAGNAKGTWYRGLSALSECVRTGTDFNATVLPSQGGLEAHMRLQEKGDIGFQFQSDLYPAWFGKGAYEGRQMQNLRAIGVAESPNYLQFVVSKDADIDSLADIEGKRFSPGPLAGTTVAMVMDLLSREKISEKFDRVNLTHSDMMNYIKDGKIDGFVLTSSLPSPALTEVSLSGDVKLLDIGEDVERTGFLEDYPFLSLANVPAGTYPNIDADVKTLSLSALLVANKNLPDETVYEITKVLYSDKCVQQAIGSHPGLKRMGEKNPLEGVIIPLHPGAKRYWEEIGLATDGVPTIETMQ
ncbi:MAG: TAXI family TRAP transporter solute-binding subunit [Rhizobiaceae bacterium]